MQATSDQPKSQERRKLLKMALLGLATLGIPLAVRGIIAATHRQPRAAYPEFPEDSIFRPRGPR